ncbi:MAG: hypothetical protein DRJ33_07610 [Candidatus Methanomethylicota archaeon]|uniref:Hydantoinase B/oxoprolinase domain-containing protein n=1 Tax=Thermoproteota archaeon TaxID=2056631 RepID=A0A497ESJ4_9CREN|nr:MAG: hypothetical protein DRJ33_07610 [Candidatus Verstraetearchaeota archaeon]
MKSGVKELPRDFVEFVAARNLGGKREVTHRALASGVIFPNDLAVTSTSGGSGYGDPLDRDPNLVIKDLENGIISEWVARNIYKVVFDPETLEIDYKATEEERRREREERKRRGKRYDKWVEEWEKMTPPKDFLKFYGTWPDAKPITEG